MNEVKLPLQKIIEINAAVETAADNDMLDGTTSYWLGRLGDFCNSPIKLFNKEREKVRKAIAEKQEPLIKERDKANEEDKVALNKQIDELNQEFSDKLEALLEQEEEIKMPDFKLAQFVATEDRTKKVTIKEGETTKDVIVTIKKGHSLVPVRFFKFMGEFVKE